MYYLNCFCIAPISILYLTVNYSTGLSAASSLSTAAFNSALGASVSSMTQAALASPLSAPARDLSACLGGLGTGMPVGGFQNVLGKIGGANLAVIGGGFAGANLAAVASLNTGNIGNIGSLGPIGSSAPQRLSETTKTVAIPPPTLLGSSCSSEPHTQTMQQYQEAASTMPSITLSTQSISSSNTNGNSNNTSSGNNDMLTAATSASNAAAAAAAAAAAESMYQEELQKKMLEDNEPQTLRQQENISIKGQSARHLVMQKLMRPSESTVVILRNMVSIDDVDEVLQEEITEECSRYGSVEHVIIYQEKQSEEEDAEVVVKIFVEFSKVSEAEAAKDSLNGRYFGGRLVKADVYDKNLYDHNDLSA